MTKIGLLSDTHGYLDPKILKYFEEVDEIWHAGDIGSLDVIEQLRDFKPLKIVYGNIDEHAIRLETDEYLFFKCENKSVLMTHIGGKPGKYYRDADELIRKYTPDIFICGHSHILLVKNDPLHKMLWMNPGACGYKGFHQVKTLLRFEIEGDKIQNLEIVELGKRA